MESPVLKKANHHSTVTRNFNLRVQDKLARGNIVTDSEMENPKLSKHGEVYTFLVSTNRYDLWIKAMKTRYWLDLGNTEEYLVNWQEATDNSGNKVEHVVKVFKQNESEKKTKSLFTLSLYNTKQKIMIQGLFRSLWIEREFKILKQMVDFMEEGKSPDDAYTQCTGTKLKFDDKDLLSSDNEFDTGIAELDTSTAEFDESKEINKDTSKRIRSSAFSPHLKASVVRKLSNKRKSANSECAANSTVRNLQDQQSYEVLLDRISNLEDIVAKFENTTASRDLMELQLNEVLKSHVDSINENLMSKFEDAKVSWKHEYHVMRNDNQEELSSWKKYSEKLELDNKKLLGKVNSLQDQISNLQNKVNLFDDSHSKEVVKNQDIHNQRKEIQEQLEHDNKSIWEEINSLQNHHSNLHKLIKSVEGETLHINKQLEECKVSVEQNLSQLDCSSNQPKSRNISQEMQSPLLTQPNLVNIEPLDKPELLTSSKTDTSANISNPQSKLFFADVIILMDSNRKFINTKQLYPGKKTSIIQCATLDKAKMILQNPKFATPQVIILHVGVNDVESSSVAVICNKFKECIDVISRSYPRTKIIISEVTPRNDDLLPNVNEVNQFLRKNLPDCTNSRNLSIMGHPNLDVDCLFDIKHLSRNTGIKRLTLNFKNSLLAAFGQQSFTPTCTHDNRPRLNNQTPTQLLPSNYANSNQIPPSSAASPIDLLQQISTENGQLLKQVLIQLQKISSPNMLNIVPTNTSTHQLTQAPSRIQSYQPPQDFQHHQAVQQWPFSNHHVTTSMKYPLHY